MLFHCQNECPLRSSFVLTNFSRTGTKRTQITPAVKPPLYKQKPPCIFGTEVTRTKCIIDDTKPQHNRPDISRMRTGITGAQHTKLLWLQSCFSIYFSSHNIEISPVHFNLQLFLSSSGFFLFLHYISMYMLQYH